MVVELGNCGDDCTLAYLSKSWKSLSCILTEVTIVVMGGDRIEIRVAGQLVFCSCLNRFRGFVCYPNQATCST
jgi:hypothetical protein